MVIDMTYHPFRAQSAFHQVSDGDGADEGRLQRKHTNRRETH